MVTETHLQTDYYEHNLNYFNKVLVNTICQNNPDRFMLKENNKYGMKITCMMNKVI